MPQMLITKQQFESLGPQQGIFLTGFTNPTEAVSRSLIAEDIRSFVCILFLRLLVLVQNHGSTSN